MHNFNYQLVTDDCCEFQGKHKIKNLQTELSDGLLLTEVIESVTHQKVPDIQRKPKTKDAMITNIQESQEP